jgi:hypothetical protein
MAHSLRAREKQKSRKADDELRDETVIDIQKNRTTFKLSIVQDN